MNDIINIVVGADLFSQLSPNMQAMVCIFAFMLVMYLVLKIFRLIGGTF